MQPQHPSPARTRTIILALVAALVIAALLWRLGVSTTITYGLAGGLIACLIIVGLDRLHSVEHRLNQPQDTADELPPREDPR